MNPEAYITATRQYVAQMNGWSLEELILEIEIHDSLSSLNSNKNDHSFGVTGNLIYLFIQSLLFMKIN